MSFGKKYQPDPLWLQLGPGFSDSVEPAVFPSHTLRYQNANLAEALGLGDLNSEQWLAHFAQFRPLPRNLPTPQALRYHGLSLIHI